MTIACPSHEHSKVWESITRSLIEILQDVSFTLHHTCAKSAQLFESHYSTHSSLFALTLCQKYSDTLGRGCVNATWLDKLAQIWFLL